MATVKPLQKDAGPANIDLSDKQWHLCRRLADNTIALATTTDQVAGCIEIPGEAPGRTTTFHTVGRSKVKITGAVATGDKLKVSATPGVATKANAGDKYFGSVAEGGPDGAIVPFEFDRGTL